MSNNGRSCENDSQSRRISHTSYKEIDIGKGAVGSSISRNKNQGV